MSAAKNSAVPTSGRSVKSIRSAQEAKNLFCANGQIRFGPGTCETAEGIAIEKHMIDSFDEVQSQCKMTEASVRISEQGVI